MRRSRLNHNSENIFRATEAPSKSAFRDNARFNDCLASSACPARARNFIHVKTACASDLGEQYREVVAHARETEPCPPPVRALYNNRNYQSCGVDRGGSLIAASTSGEGSRNPSLGVTGQRRTAVHLPQWPRPSRRTHPSRRARYEVRRGFRCPGRRSPRAAHRAHPRSEMPWSHQCRSRTSVRGPVSVSRTPTIPPDSVAAATGRRLVQVGSKALVRFAPSSLSSSQRR